MSKASTTARKLPTSEGRKSHAETLLNFYTQKLDFAFGYLVGNDDYKGLRDWKLHVEPDSSIRVSDIDAANNGSILVLTGDYNACHSTLTNDWNKAKTAAKNYFTVLGDANATPEQIDTAKSDFEWAHARAFAQLNAIGSSEIGGDHPVTVQLSTHAQGIRTENHWKQMSIKYKDGDTGQIQDVKVAVDNYVDVSFKLADASKSAGDLQRFFRQYMDEAAKYLPASGPKR